MAGFYISIPSLWILPQDQIQYLFWTLSSPLSHKLRFCLANLRCSTHHLEIERGRHQNVTREVRICSICNTKQLGDELHFILSCPLLHDLRTHFLPKWLTLYPTEDNAIRLFNSQDAHTIRSLCIFICKAMEIRSEILKA